MSAWKLETAKARFSEVVRQAREEGPQTITVRGKDSAVVLSAEDFRRLSAGSIAGSWVDAFRVRCTVEIDLERDRDLGRDVEL